MKNILFIATGGTIASKRSANGLTPKITPEELLSFVPDVNEICNVQTIQLFFALCQKYPRKLVVISTQVAHEGSDMTVYEVGNEIKNSCHILESYDMTLESVVAKLMWLLANVAVEERENFFYKKTNYDLIFPKRKKLIVN